MKILTQLKLDNSTLGLHKVSIKNTDCLSICAKFSKSKKWFADFTIGMIWNETGHLLKCVKLCRNLINIDETKHVLRRNIAAISLKISSINLYSVKSYDKTNMKV